MTDKKTAVSATQSLTLDTITVRSIDGLFCLNDLHKAAGGEAKHQPSLFLRLDSTQALVAEISNSTEKQSYISKSGRTGGGTYACRELVIAYAAWISAAFHLKVIRVFLENTRPYNPAIDYIRISPEQAQQLQELVQKVVDSGVQKHGETWARFHRKFRVNSYLQLPASQFDEACQYLANKLPQPTQLNVDQQVSVKGSRWLHSFDEDGNEAMQRIPSDAVVMSVPKFIKAITNNDIPASTETLIHIAQASMAEVQRRMTGQASLQLAA